MRDQSNDVRKPPGKTAEWDRRFPPIDYECDRSTVPTLAPKDTRRPGEIQSAKKNRVWLLDHTRQNFNGQVFFTCGEENY